MIVHAEPRLVAGLSTLATVVGILGAQPLLTDQPAGTQGAPAASISLPDGAPGTK